MTALTRSRSYEVFHRYHECRNGVYYFFRIMHPGTSELYAYFYDMVDAITEDVKETGSSWLLRYMMSIADCHHRHLTLDWYVVRYLFLIGSGYDDSAVASKVTIPYSGQYFDHSLFSSTITVTSFTKEVCASVERMLGGNSPAHDLEEEVAKLREQLTVRNCQLQECQNELDEYRRATEAQARQRVADASQRILSEASIARREAETKLLRADDEARERIAAAEAKAGRIIDDAHQQAAEHIDAAQDEANEIRQAADAAARDLAHQARADVLREASLMNSRCTPGSSYDAIRQDMSRQASDIQRFIVDELNKLQTQLGTAFGSFGDKLADARGSISTSLNRWRTDLYAGEYKAVAMFYVNLYRFVNQAMDQRIADAEDETVRTSLQGVQQVLLGHLGRCEVMLQKLGLVLIRPAAGDLSDDVYHTGPAGVVEPGEIIESCICPGVALSGDCAPVLIPAQVITANTDEELDAHE